MSVCSLKHPYSLLYSVLNLIIENRIQLFIHTREMLRSLVSKLFLWICFFEIGQANISFPPCIRIKGDISDQDVDTNRIIQQPFAFHEHDDTPNIPRYISEVFEYEFIFSNAKQFKWFLIPLGTTANQAYLKALAPTTTEGVVMKNPLLVEKSGWKIYTDAKWQEVISTIKIIEDNGCQIAEQQSNQASGISNQNEQASNQTPQVSNQNEQWFNQDVLTTTPVTNQKQEVSTEVSGLSISALPTTGETTARSTTRAKTSTAPISDFEFLPPMRPTWGQWSEWNECSKSCGEGTRSQSRKCNAKGPFYFPGIPMGCNGGDTKHQICFITCEERKSTVSPVIEITTKATDQTTSSCKLVHYAVSYTFHNGAAKCPHFGSGWRYPPSKFQGRGTFDNFWIGARQTDGKWVDEFNQNIPEPNFVPARRKGKMDLQPVGATASSDICLYWKGGYILAGPCDKTRIVICCEPSAIASIEISQGKYYHTISRNY